MPSGHFVTFGLYRGFGDVFSPAADPELQAFTLSAAGYPGWI
ncbi:MAG: hypothetical protein R3D62_09880 [Xanthobacteraceae bacterium]